MPYISSGHGRGFLQLPGAGGPSRRGMPVRKIATHDAANRARPGQPRCGSGWSATTYLCGASLVADPDGQTAPPTRRLDDVEHGSQTFGADPRAGPPRDGTLDTRTPGSPPLRCRPSLSTRLAGSAQPWTRPRQRPQGLKRHILGYAFLYFGDPGRHLRLGPTPRPDGRTHHSCAILSLGPSRLRLHPGRKARPPRHGSDHDAEPSPRPRHQFEINDWGTNIHPSFRPVMTAVTEAAVVGHRRDGGTEPATGRVGRDHHGVCSRANRSSISSRGMGRQDRISRGRRLLLGLVRSPNLGPGCWEQSTGRSPRNSLARTGPLERLTLRRHQFGTAGGGERKTCSGFGLPYSLTRKDQLP